MADLQPLDCGLHTAFWHVSLDSLQMCRRETVRVTTVRTVRVTTVRRPASEMTYIVSSGALNSTHSLTHRSKSMPIRKKKMRNRLAGFVAHVVCPSCFVAHIYSPITCSVDNVGRCVMNRWCPMCVGVGNEKLWAVNTCSVAHLSIRVDHVNIWGWCLPVFGRSPRALHRVPDGAVSSPPSTCSAVSNSLKHRLR